MKWNGLDYEGFAMRVARLTGTTHQLRAVQPCNDSPNDVAISSYTMEITVTSFTVDSQLTASAHCELSDLMLSFGYSDCPGQRNAPMPQVVRQR